MSKDRSFTGSHLVLLPKTSFDRSRIFFEEESVEDLPEVESNLVVDGLDDSLRARWSAYFGRRPTVSEQVDDVAAECDLDIYPPSLGERIVRLFRGQRKR